MLGTSMYMPTVTSSDNIICNYNKTTPYYVQVIHALQLTRKQLNIKDNIICKFDCNLSMT
jgi:hypothetical protein